MKLSDIQQQWSVDCEVDDTSLDQESLKLPNLHSKYLSYWNEENLNYKKWKSHYYILYKKKWEYYSGKMDEDALEQEGWEPFQLKILKQDIEIYLKGDKDIIDIQSKIDYTKQKIDALDQIIKSISNRGYLIKNAIDFMRFQMGS